MKSIDSLASAAKALNTDELDALLRKLAVMRSERNPPVAQQVDTESEVLVEDMPALSIRARRSGGFRLWLRHTGYGWLAYQIDDRTAAGLANFAAKHISPVEMNAADLIGKQSGGFH